MKRLAIVCFVAFSFCAASCSRIADSETELRNGSGSIISEVASIHVKEIYKMESPLKILVLLENKGDAGAYELNFSVKPRTTGTVLETIVVSDNMTLAAHSIKWKEISFSVVTAHSAYDDLSFDFSWTEAKRGSIAVSALVR